MKFASVDIGTNTVRLLIAEQDESGQMKEIVLRREITRLGGGFDGIRLHDAAKKRTLSALESFSALIAETGTEKVRAVATSVVREASDGALFTEEIRQKTGLSVEVIDGDREAGLALRGVLSGLKARDKRALVFDIGGGSTEFIVSDGGMLKGMKSVNMGVVSLTERYLKSDPPSSEDRAAIDRSIDKFLQTIETELTALDLVRGQNEAVLVGTAGTITTLAALDLDLEVYDPRQINNYLLSRTRIKSLFERLVSLTHAERAALRALEAGRADLIIAGAMIVLRVMERFAFDELIVSDYGLLEGVLLDLANRERVH